MQISEQKPVKELCNYIELPHSNKLEWDRIAFILKQNISQFVDFESHIRRIGGEVNTSGLYAIKNSMTEQEEYYYVHQIFPFIHEIVLQAPLLFPNGRIFILTQGSNDAVRLNKLQVLNIVCSGLMGCYNNKLQYPRFQFNNFTISLQITQLKLRMVLEYIRFMYLDYQKDRKKMEDEYITYKRQKIDPSKINWTKNPQLLTKVFISQNNVDEVDTGAQVLEVSKHFGKKVLFKGRDDEDIRMCMNTELLPLLLFSDHLTKNESILVYGTSKYSSYYTDKVGSCNFLCLEEEDTTPEQLQKQKQETREREEVVIDDSDTSSENDDELEAKPTPINEPEYRKPIKNRGIYLINSTPTQIMNYFKTKYILKKLNKALSAFWIDPDALMGKPPPIVSGKWGYVYEPEKEGDPIGHAEVMILILICASACAERELVLCINDSDCKINELKDFLTICYNKNISIGKIVTSIPLYSDVLGKKIKISLLKFLTKLFQK
jgi:hypothetical protein